MNSHLIVGRLALVGSLVSGCRAPVILPDLFVTQVTEIHVEIDYQSGLLPYFGSEDSDETVSGLFPANVEALFSQRPRAVSVPAGLDEMSAFDEDGRVFQTEDLYELSLAHRDQWDTDALRSFHVLILDGVFAIGETEYPDTLGVALVEPRIIGIFRQSLDGLEVQEGMNDFHARAEQLTLVHEFGHAVGLVGNGLEVVTDHLDEATGHHCTAPACIMHHSAASAIGARTGAVFAPEGDMLELFDQRCAADISAAEGD